MQFLVTPDVVSYCVFLLIILGFVGIVLKINEPASVFWYVLFVIFVTYSMLPMPLW